MSDIIIFAIIILIIISMKTKAAELATENQIISNYGSLIISNAAKRDIDPAVIAAIIEAESSGDRYAVRNEYSSDGSIWDRSIGLMQILTGTATWIAGQGWGVNYSGDVNELFDPAINISLGSAYLAYQMSRYGSTGDAVAAYNAGSCYRNGKSCLSQETGSYTNSKGITNVQDYVDRVMPLIEKYRKILSSYYSSRLDI